MEVERAMVGNLSMMSDESSMGSMHFVMGLQELKNLRRQLYSAAEYCEKSYLNSEQKQMVLDNLKDYAVRALANAIDRLGTVAYKFSDILEQQTIDISFIDLKVACLNQRLLKCQIYMDKEGLKRQQVLAIIPRHHKHYILPNYVNKKGHFNPHIQTDPSQPIQARRRFYSSGASAAKTLSWHLASETQSTLNGTPRVIMSTEDSKTYENVSGGSNLFDAEERTRNNSTPASRVATKTRVAWLHSMEGSKPLTPCRSFDDPSQRQIVHPPVRSKSMLSAFFVKQKTPKVKTGA